jgi:zinc protease
MSSPTTEGSALDRSLVPPPGPLRPFEFPRIERFTLDNGLPVTFCRTGRLPIATASLLLPAGGVREDGGEAGLATLTAALLESGAGELSAAEIADRLEASGLQLGSSASWEVSHVDITGLVGKLDVGAELLADLVRRPRFPEPEVERLREEQLAGIMQRRSDPRGLANEFVARSVFDEDTPFSRPLSGTSATVSTLDRESVERFHRSFYSPRDATLIVAGALEQEDVRRFGQIAFDGWDGPAVPVDETRVGPRRTSRHVVVVDRPGAVQSEVRVAHVGVSRTTPDYFPLLVLNTALGGAFSSRLNLNLRERHGFTYGVQSSFVMRRVPGPFIVSTAVQTEVTAAAVREILGEVERIRVDPITPGELADARQFLAGTFPLRLQTMEGVASRLAELVVYGLPDSYLADFPERVLGVTPEEVLEAARRYLHPDRAAIVVVGDATSVAPALEELRLGPVEIVRTPLES